MVSPPRFLDEELSPATQSGSTPTAEPPPVERLAAPVLLEAEPNAPAALQGRWQPKDLPASAASAGGVHWMALGIAVVLVSFAVFSAISFVLSIADRSIGLGRAAGLALSIGVGLIGYGIAGEWRGYRQLRIVDRMRTALVGDAVSIEVLRADALSWLEQVATSLPDAAAARRAIQSAPTVIEIQALLRDRVADPLHQEAKTIGQRAALQAAGLIAISPHASWDGVIAGLRGLLIIRDVGRLFGLRPGMAVTVLLVRKVAWTAAAVSGTDLLWQGLADHALSGMPFVKHVGEAVPGGVAGVRLYRLANIAAEACCPVAR